MNEICVTCGLPKDLCVCETIAKESQKITVKLEKKKFGKKYTVVHGIEGKEIDLKELTRKLKNALACGGTVKEGKIELQGDHKLKAKKILEGMGFPSSTIELK